MYLEKVDTATETCTKKRKNNKLGQHIRKLKQNKGLYSASMIILHSIPLQGIMLSASQINFDITNS